MCGVLEKQDNGMEVVLQVLRFVVEQGIKQKWRD